MKLQVLTLYVTLGVIPCLCYSHGERTSKARRRPLLDEQGLTEVYNWSQFDFNFPSNEAREEALQSGVFVPGNTSAPSGLEVFGSRVFISLPRWRNGVPATLNTISFPSDTQSPLLTPYPNWDMNRQGNCDGLTSVYRMQVDKCDRLWVLDTGTVNTLSNAESICPMQVVVFDLNNDEVILKYRLPSDVLKERSQLVNIEVEYPDGSCENPRDAMLYIADTSGFALIVVDLAANSSWAVEDKTMFPSPEAGTYDIAGETFELMDGVLALALSPENATTERGLYYSSMSSFRQRWVSTAVLRNQSQTSRPELFHTAAQSRSSQSGDAAIDSQGVMFFGLLGENSVVCWNTNKTFQPSNVAILAKDKDKLQFPVSVVVDRESRLWVLASKFQSFLLGTLSTTETNFRIFMAPSTADVVRGTTCEIREPDTPKRGGNRKKPTRGNKKQ